MNHPQHRTAIQKPQLLLQQFFASCTKHRSYHEGQRVSSHSVDTEEEVPEFCQSMLASLRKILPKLERNTENLVPLCDYYAQVLTGSFCPHAPHSFLMGRNGGSEVFPRVHLLLQASLQSDHPQDHVVLCRTMAQLLAWIPGVPHLRQEWAESTVDIGLLLASFNNGKRTTTPIADWECVGGGLIIPLPDKGTILALQSTLWSVLYHWWHIYIDKQVALEDDDEEEEFLGDTGLQDEVHGAARQVLLSSASSPRARSAAIRIVQQFLQDDFLIARAAVVALRQHTPASSSSLSSYLRKLAAAVCRCSDESCLKLLLDGLSVKDVSVVPQHKPVLEQAILRTIHVALCRQEGDSPVVAVSLEESTFHLLLAWLREPALHDLSIWVLSKVICIDDWNDLLRYSSETTTEPQRPYNEPSPRKRIRREEDDDDEVLPAMGGYVTPASARKVFQTLVRRALRVSVATTETQVADATSLLRLLPHDDCAFEKVREALSESLLQGMQKQEYSPDDCRLQMLITCGVHSSCERFRTATQALFRKSLSRSHAAQTHLPLIPLPLLESLYHGGIMRTKIGTGVVRANFFDWGVVEISYDGNSTFSSQWRGPFVPMNASDESQIERLRDLPPAGSSDPMASLRQRTSQALLLQPQPLSSPELRLRQWQSMAWLLQVAQPVELRRLLGSPAEDKNWIYFLLDTAFADEDTRVRSYTSRRLGAVLAANRWAGTEALLAKTNQEWKNSEVQDLADRFFSRVDHWLHERCCVPQSQLSFTVASNPPRDKQGQSQAQERAAIFQRAAVRSLLSLCREPTTPLARRIFVAALTRVIRLWAMNNGTRGEGQWFCFAEISRLCRSVNLAWIVREHCMESFTPNLFSEILMPNSGILVGERGVGIENIRPETREKQFLLLSVFIQNFLLNTNGEKRLERPLVTLSHTDVADLERYFEDAVPYVFAQLIVEKDFDSLRLTSNYKLFLLVQKKFEAKRRVRVDNSGVRVDQALDTLVGARKSSFLESSLMSRVWTTDLQGRTSDLCMSNYKSIIPLVLMTAGPSELSFLSRTVLGGKNPLKRAIQAFDLGILKQLVWQVGSTKGVQEMAIRAIKLAAIAREEDLDSGRETSKNLSLSMSLDCSQDKSVHRSLSGWISKHFMFLLVNLVQSRWRTRSDDDRIQALRCFCFMMDFLKPEESSQYFPQIMATFNAAMALPEGHHPQKADHVQFLAVQVLSKFIRLVAIDNWEILGQNLNVVVVSLIPIVTCTDGVPYCDFRAKAREEAISLLEWLVEDKLGEKLAGFFSEIPFVPSSAALEKMRTSLRGLGVDFDNVITTQGTQEGMSRQSYGSVDGSASFDNGSVSSSNALRQAALRRRLEIVCPLLSNENTGIRQVVLKHATDLVRANRELFHALVENEGDTSMKQYITLARPGTSGASRGTVTEFVEALLNRCVNETDGETRILLAACIGEVGAIAVYNLEERKYSSYSGEKSNRGPWHSRAARYELTLVSNQLVAALKSAPTSNDQHKIGMSIQQILTLLDRSVSEGGSGPKDESKNFEGKQAMSSWLRGKLSVAGVLEVVEPFWQGEFCELETTVKKPPFFKAANSYFGWMSNWCRYMVHQSHAEKKSKWSELFYACRTSFRTNVGLGVAEFLLPVLVLDRICFGQKIEELATLTEIRDALTFRDESSQNMPHSERQKVVSTLLDLIDTLQLWSETEKETKRPQKSPLSSNRGFVAGDHWPIDDSLVQIDDLVASVPLSLRAQAAAAVGMHARALRLFEMLARSRVAEEVFNGAASPNHDKRTRSRAAGFCEGSDLSCMKESLGALNDYETMACLMENESGTDPSARIRGSIKLKEVSSNWDGALQDYERALQLTGSGTRDPRLQRGALRCLLELGHFDSVLNQASGLLQANSSSSSLSNAALGSVPIAIEASWRLGNWDSLSSLVSIFESHAVEKKSMPFDVSQGKIMLNLQKKELDSALSAIREARVSVMDKLSIAASEGYSRSFDYLVKLHALREAEDVAELVCGAHPSAIGDIVNEGAFAWDRRLRAVGPAGVATLMNCRLALARLAGDSSFEGALFLDMGRRARKSGLQGMAANALAQAEAVFHCVDPANTHGSGLIRSSLQIQFAKLKHECGESSAALRMLHNEDMESLVSLEDKELRKEAIRRVTELLGTDKHEMSEEQAIDVFAKSALKSTQWMIEGGLKGGTEIMSRFRILHRVAPKWGKGHFCFAKYVDSILQSRVAVLYQRSPDYSAAGNDEAIQSLVISQDKTCQRYVLLAIKHYVEALIVDTKNVYQALPRLLSLWFEFTSIGRDGSVVKNSEGYTSLLQYQEEANAVLANKYKDMPAPAFYTALPQLISRIKHPDKGSAMIVRGILRRVLTKYPAQAMWPLAWLRQSRQKERCKIGDEIFREAERLLMKATNKTHYSLLVASKSLFSYFQKLAKFEVKGSRVAEINVKAWKGEVDLVEFIPPVQAALSASLSCGDSGRSRDLFPRHVPRMRAFDSKIRVMTSKARPKIIKAFVVSADSVRNRRAMPTRGSKEKENDIGEICFLVKQEAKGDLRKDARVQDLNNVINRLMASSDSSGTCYRQQRRLRLRTFSVTCLSEDTGILEWVPGTASFRSLVAKTYNPQASPHSSRRGGSRLANFGDPMLKTHYNKCQAMFFASKDLKNAAKLFEQLCLKPHPPVFYWWFVQTFQDPHAWYEARTRFTLSCAAWSAIGHVIGVGDRHSENILLDTGSGECVHVDFDCIFDKGLHLPQPEVIPFRLTQNMLDAFGPTGADGVFSGGLKTAMRTLRDNRDTLLSVLEPFLKDPVIDWKRHRSQQQSSSRIASSEERQTREAKRSIKVIDERLQGIYNLRNPNYKRICLPAYVEQGDDGHMLPLSVEGQVHKMIAEATSSENLVQMYIGWMPWI